MMEYWSGGVLRKKGFHFLCSQVALRLPLEGSAPSEPASGAPLSGADGAAPSNMASGIEQRETSNQDHAFPRLMLNSIWCHAPAARLKPETLFPSVLNPEP